MLLLCILSLSLSLSLSLFILQVSLFQEHQDPDLPLQQFIIIDNTITYSAYSCSWSLSLFLLLNLVLLEVSSF